MTMLTTRAAMFYLLCYVCCTLLYLCVLYSMVAATLSLVTPAMRNHLMGALPFELGSLLGGTYGMTQHIPHFLSPFLFTSFLLSFFFLALFLSSPVSSFISISPLLFSPNFLLSLSLSFFMCVCLFRSAVPSEGEGGVQHDRHPSRSLHHSPASKQVTATLSCTLLAFVYHLHHYLVMSCLMQSSPLLCFSFLVPCYPMLSYVVLHLTNPLHPALPCTYTHTSTHIHTHTHTSTHTDTHTHTHSAVGQMSGLTAYQLEMFYGLQKSMDRTG